MLVRDPVVDRPAQVSNGAARGDLASPIDATSHLVNGAGALNGADALDGAVRGSRDGSDGIPKRVQEMYWLHSGGRTLEEVGRAFGITRQRVSQLFQQASLPIVRRPAKPRKTASEKQQRIARAALENAARAAQGPLSAHTFEALRARTRAPWPSAPVIARAIGEGSWPGALRAVGIESVKDNQRARLERRRELIADLWTEELTCAQIADVLETTPGSVSVEVARMRALGYDLPGRRRRRAS